MSKKGRKSRKGPRSGKRAAVYNVSTIAQHKRQANKLTPPLASLPNFSPSSWVDDHMPEMLWTVLLAEGLPRTDYLEIFTAVGVLTRDWAHEPPLAEGVFVPVLIDHTRLAGVSEDEFAAFFHCVTPDSAAAEALRPLLLIESLPDADRWRRALAVERRADDGAVMTRAVAGVFDHQSERSTDIRWFNLMVMAVSGRMHFPTTMEEQIEELRHYPNRGDLRRVRPFIRSAEMNLRRSPPSRWVANFWKEAFERTYCVDPAEEDHYLFAPHELDARQAVAVRKGIVDRFHVNLNSKRVDPRLDGAFGLVLYAHALLMECSFHYTQTRITGRLVLRTVVEAMITLRYLRMKDDPALWLSFRVFGSGQAKLAFLQALEASGDVPGFVEMDTLQQIANEDTWQEFLQIDLGHWASSNLRTLAIQSETKDVYDRYYAWTSNAAHAHWAAIRDSSLVTCHNPLHRFHRIPRGIPRELPSVEPDVVQLVNAMITDLDALFPAEYPLPAIELVTSAPAEVSDAAEGAAD